MSTRDGHPVGAPCWVETLQPDPAAARDFYAALFGWEFGEPEPMPGGLPGEYHTARLGGRRVAGIGAAADPSAVVWNTRVRVASVDDTVERATRAGGQVALGPAGGDGDRHAVVVDPAGAAFSVWEAGERDGAEVVNEPGAWQMSSLHTPDPPGASAFYAAVLGWRSEPMAPGTPIALFRLDGYEGGEPGQAMPRDVVAVMTPAAGGVPPHWNVNLRVEDADAVAARTADLGGAVLMAPMDTPGFRSAVLADPQGGVFSISQLVIAS